MPSGLRPGFSCLLSTTRGPSVVPVPEVALARSRVSATTSLVARLEDLSSCCLTASTAISIVSTAWAMATCTVCVPMPGTLRLIRFLASDKEGCHSGRFIMAKLTCNDACNCDAETASSTAFFVMSSTSTGIVRICATTSSSSSSISAMPRSTVSTLSCSVFFATWALASKDCMIISGMTSRLSMAASADVSSCWRIFVRSAPMVSWTSSA
mmetsp:Transcript_101546/g.219245  ORF Transcript_101546/g.219245 Transcript_101546/m.219245 type:complete len:211 (+) Transcript_101546:756-1388(+)